jgi:hypothetical protein
LTVYPEDKAIKQAQQGFFFNFFISFYLFIPLVLGFYHRPTERAQQRSASLSLKQQLTLSLFFSSCCC